MNIYIYILFMNIYIYIKTTKILPTTTSFMIISKKSRILRKRIVSQSDIEISSHLPEFIR